MVDSRKIGIIASKRNFDVNKERTLMEKAKTTRCNCKHWTQTTPCLYRLCRHMPENHFGGMAEILTIGGDSRNIEQLACEACNLCSKPVYESSDKHYAGGLLLCS